MLADDAVAVLRGRQRRVDDGRCGDRRRSVCRRCSNRSCGSRWNNRCRRCDRRSDDWRRGDRRCRRGVRRRRCGLWLSHYWRHHHSDWRAQRTGGSRVGQRLQCGRRRRSRCCRCARNGSDALRLASARSNLLRKLIGGRGGRRRRSDRCRRSSFGARRSRSAWSDSRRCGCVYPWLGMRHRLDRRCRGGGRRRGGECGCQFFQAIA
ncbi:hypothetical protein PXO_01432 [Xanthomonas oryzae pv. oryzae PXO99A]|uniref:Uncharacterized protein n=1 Tax=Xanthomonas oryzae pv. oryzae (strain PXO99A) TaxID=360094 RepID=A0A0K0GLY3_XANOP|nr:hypothetical protein PXO_01432 [Xanthomonas oryzae pv. oryzae PXO99A]